MSFWDSLKPKQRDPVATAVSVTPDGKIVSLEWDDGLKVSLSSRSLRQYCPCAECVEEWSGKRTFDIDTIAKDMKVIEASPVGNYALTFTFGDLHRTGIFNWATLRELSAHLAMKV